jgi:hypothetical protein
MTRFFVRSLLTLAVLAVSIRTAHADRGAVADALGKLSEYADGLASSAARSGDRAVRKKLAPKTTDVADDLGALASRTRKDVAYTALAREAAAIGRDAAALVELADEAEDKAERKALRAQAVALEQGIATVRGVMEALAREDDKPKQPAKPVPMKQAAFEQLVGAIRAASFDDDKLEVVRHAAQTNWFSSNQVAAVMDLLSFDEGKIDAAVAMWPHITDPENSFVIFKKLAFDSSREELRKRVGK